MASTFGTSDSWGGGSRQADMRSRRVQLLAAATDAQLGTKFDKAGGEISGDVNIAGTVTVANAATIERDLVLPVGDSRIKIGVPDDLTGTLPDTRMFVACNDDTSTAATFQIARLDQMGGSLQTERFHLSVGNADPTKFHRIRSSGGYNEGFAIETRDIRAFVDFQYRYPAPAWYGQPPINSSEDLGARLVMATSSVQNVLSNITDLGGQTYRVASTELLGPVGPADVLLVRQSGPLVTAGTRITSIVNGTDFTTNNPLVVENLVVRAVHRFGAYMHLATQFGNALITDYSNSLAEVPASAQLEVRSTTRGFLPPRMTAAQALAIASPAEGLMIYVNDTGAAPFTAKGWFGYDGAAWKRLSLDL